MVKKENIVRYTSDELRNMPSQTDWERVHALTDENIEQAIAADPDAAPVLTEEFFKTAEIIRSSDKKRRITIMVDEEILAFFQKQGKTGYQKRMCEVLKAYVQQDIIRRA